MKVPFDALLVPTDLSEIGNLAIPVAYRLAADGAVVHILHVAEPPYLGNPMYAQYVQGYTPDPEEVRAGEERVRRRLHDLTPEGALAKGVRTQHHLVHAVNVADAIEAQVGALDADVVVMATHGRTGLGRILMGSVATDVVKRESLPVILVHEDRPR